MKSEWKTIVTTAVKVFKGVETKFKVSFVIALFIMLATGGLSNIPAVSLGKLVDSMYNRSILTIEDAIPFLMIVAGSIVLKEALTVLRKYLVENTCSYIERERLVSLIAHLLKLNMDFFSKMKAGALNGRIARSIEGLIKMIKLLFIDFFPVTFGALFSLGIAISKNLLLGLIMAMVIPIGLFIVFWQVRSQKGIRLELLRSKEEIDGTIIEILGGLEVVRVGNTWEHETGKVEKYAEQLRKKEIRHHVSMSYFDAAKYLNEGIFLIGVISSSIYMATRGIISYGDILTYAMLFSSILNPLREIHRILDEAHEATLRVTDLFELFQNPQDESFQVSKPAKKLISKTEDIALDIKGVSFHYSDKPDKYVLNHVDCNIKTGEIIGIVGKSGCGKSSLLKMILKLHSKSKGSIHIWGHPLESVTREQISKHIGYVGQTPFIFSGKISDNISYHKLDARPEEIMEAAKLANLHEEIMAMEHGYDSQVSERGTNLSGGQRQRIALARVMLSRPEILILDEATSALDNINEAYILKNLQKTMEGRTIIMVAHRLSTLKDTDRILVFDEGRLVEQGSYKSLSLNRQSMFSQLENIV